MRTEYNPSSDEYTETLTQYLQEERKFKMFGITLFSYWKTIDVEVVPSFAWIQRNTLGFTTWKSKWCNLEDISWDNNDNN